MHWCVLIIIKYDLTNHANLWSRLQPHSLPPLTWAAFKAIYSISRVWPIKGSGLSHPTTAIHLKWNKQFKITKQTCTISSSALMYIEITMSWAPFFTLQFQCKVYVLRAQKDSLALYLLMGLYTKKYTLDVLWSIHYDLERFMMVSCMYFEV